MSETPVPDLEQRVAALEAALGPAADFSLLPLRPDEVRQLLRECVTVVKPGETLVIRDRNWIPSQVNEIQRWMDDEHESGRISFKVLALIGEEMAVTEAGGEAPGAA